MHHSTWQSPTIFRRKITIIKQNQVKKPSAESSSERAICHDRLGDYGKDKKREEKTENTWRLLTTCVFRCLTHAWRHHLDVFVDALFTFELRHSIIWFRRQCLVKLAHTAHIKTSKPPLCILILHQDLGREEEQEVTPSWAARRLEPQLWTLKRVKTNHCKHRKVN